ncbi:3-dehydroquinate synthase [Lentisphaerota bacterium WC36G]|nr:3-dehydroquinate synthase [Lentisphaerae bacterium WC36]
MFKNYTVNVPLDERSYQIQIGGNIIENAPNFCCEFIDKKNCLIITDSNVVELYGGAIAEKVEQSGAISCNTEFFVAGEENKTLATMEQFYSSAVKYGLDRKSLFIALGGGVTGDMCGFLAASYMRGVNFIQIPTSLLAMVDSSVGGKTGVDLPEGKNLVGAFWQPQLVLIDPCFLKTLPKREILCGLAEIIKYGVIIDKSLFDNLEQNIDKINSLDINYYSEIIARCCQIKADVVAQDEREGGIRAILNYGHTFGHAIEKVSNFTVGHGEAVAVGMCMAANLAVAQGLMAENDAVRQKKLIEEVGLKTSIKDFDVVEIIDAMSSDKKCEAGENIFIVPRSIGKVEIMKGFSLKAIVKAVESCCE